MIGLPTSLVTGIVDPPGFNSTSTMRPRDMYDIYKINPIEFIFPNAFATNVMKNLIMCINTLPEM